MPPRPTANRAPFNVRIDNSTSALRGAKRARSPTLDDLDAAPAELRAKLTERKSGEKRRSEKPNPFVTPILGRTSRARKLCVRGPEDNLIGPLPRPRAWTLSPTAPITTRNTTPPPATGETPRPTPLTASYLSSLARPRGPRPRTLEDMNLPRLTVEKFESEEKEAAFLDFEFVQEAFELWKAQTELGNSVLVYGFGSTYEILDYFARTHHCEDGGALSVDGFAGVDSREILIQIAKYFFKGKDFTEESDQVILGRIEKDPRKLYLILHCIDAESLRTEKHQTLLSKIASLPNIAMIASMQNVDGNKLWDTELSAVFSWSMHAMHTCQYYEKETAGRPLLIQPTITPEERVTDAVDNALLILKSLVSNAQQTFIVLIEYSMKKATPLRSSNRTNNPRSKDTSATEAVSIPFGELYDECKAKFIVGNTSILKSFLGEFVDHGLVSCTHCDTGDDRYTVTMEKDAMKRIIAKYEKKDEDEHEHEQ